jgi:hypothetical protein
MVRGVFMACLALLEWVELGGLDGAGARIVYDAVANKRPFLGRRVRDS